MGNDLKNIQRQFDECAFAEQHVLNTIEQIIKERIDHMTAEKRSLRWRLSEPYRESNREKDRMFPRLPEEYSWDSYLVGVKDARTDVQYNFKFADGKCSEVRAERNLHPHDFEAEALDIRQIVLWYNDADGMLFGIQLFTDSGKKVLQTHYNFESKRSKQILLEPDERIIGFVAASYS